MVRMNLQTIGGTMTEASASRRGIVGASLAAGLAVAVTSGKAGAQQNASGTDKFGEIVARGKLVVGTGNDIPPFYFMDKSGALAGMEIDLARLLAKGLFNDAGKVEFVAQT